MGKCDSRRVAARGAELCVRLNVPFRCTIPTRAHYGPTKSDEESYLDRENRLETDPRFHTVVEDAQDIDEILTRMNGTRS